MPRDKDGKGAPSMVPPPEVAPVEVGGVRLAPAIDGLPLDATDTSGWLEATKVGTGARLWVVQVFTAPEDGRPARSGGSGVHVVALEAAGEAVVVTDSLGRRFHVDPETGYSTPME